MNYAIKSGARAKETRITIDVEISNRQYIADAIVYDYGGEDYHVEWLSVRRPGSKKAESFEDENWRDALIDYAGDAIEAANG